MEAINVESNVDVLLFNVTASNREEDFHDEAKTYLTYKIGKFTYLLDYCIGSFYICEQKRLLFHYEGWLIEFLIKN